MKTFDLTRPAIEPNLTKFFCSKKVLESLTIDDLMLLFKRSLFIILAVKINNRSCNKILKAFVTPDEVLQIVSIALFEIDMR